MHNISGDSWYAPRYEGGEVPSTRDVTIDVNVVESILEAVAAGNKAEAARIRKEHGLDTWIDEIRVGNAALSLLAFVGRDEDITAMEIARRANRPESNGIRRLIRELSLHELVSKEMREFKSNSPSGKSWRAYYRLTDKGAKALGG